MTRALDTTKNQGGTITSVARAETNANDEYDVLLYRGVSGPLGTQEIDVNVNVVIGVSGPAAANDHWHLHIYTTQGDSDTVREVGLDNYREAAGVNEWPATAVGVALNAAQSCHIHTQDGDRLVVEIGYAARNTVTTSYTGTLWYGRSRTALSPQTSRCLATRRAWPGISRSGAPSRKARSRRVRRRGRSKPS